AALVAIRRPVPSEDLVHGGSPSRPNRMWCADVTQHRTGQCWLYLAVVLDCFSRRVVGWAMVDHLRAEIVVDALQMALWQRRPGPGTIHHADHCAQYTSWAFGHRLRGAGLLGSMASVGDVDNSVAESFFATLQTELLDRSSWATRTELASAIFAFIEAFYNPRRRHSTCGYLSPADYEAAAAGRLTNAAA
ncbi:MAG: IS3 family transposase, partial [Mycobacteriales bacterium]